jgi:hypothetical protein
MMALVILVVAVALMFGAFQQQTLNDQKTSDVLSRDRALDQREQELDQRRAELNQRDDDLASQGKALNDRQAALDAQKADQDADDAELSAREQALSEGKKALETDQAALAQAQKDLSAREQAQKDKQAEDDAKLADYEALQKAVDDALGERTRVAAALQTALKTSGVWKTDTQGAVSTEVETLFDGASTALSKSGQQELNQLIPAWVKALEGANVPVISVEVASPSGETQALDLAAQRALTILQYAQSAPALSAEVREAMLQKGVSGARIGVAGESRAVFRFYLNYDALQAALAG